MVERDSWGHSYSVVRGEILGFMEDERVRKHLPRMFSLIKTKVGGSKTIRYRRSLNHKTMPARDRRTSVATPSAPVEKSKPLGSGGSMVARLKLKE